MGEILVRRIITNDLPYDLEEPGDEREITRGLMRLSQQALSKYVDKALITRILGEADDDLKTEINPKLAACYRL
jgi:hypothetical protein